MQIGKIQLIVGAGWHPLLRINHQGTYRVPPQAQWRSLANVLGAPGQSWSGRVACFKTNPLECTLLARWDLGHKDPWLILTDIEPEQADALWYGLRLSTECVYRDIKSDGWQWHNTCLLSPQRAERLWLAIAVSTLWMVILGGEAENLFPPSKLGTTSRKTHYLLKTSQITPTSPYFLFSFGLAHPHC